MFVQAYASAAMLFSGYTASLTKRMLTTTGLHEAYQKMGMIQILTTNRRTTQGGGLNGREDR